MKKFLVILAAFSFSAAAVSAQTTAPAPAAHGQHRQGEHKGDHKGGHAKLTPEQRADRSAQHMTKQLGLSAAQTAQVRQLQLQRAQQMQAAKAQAGTTPDKKQRHQAMKAGKAQYAAQLKQILSAEQYAKYTQLQAERMQKRKAHRQHMAPTPQQGKS